MQGTPEAINSGVPHVKFTAPTRKVLLPLNRRIARFRVVSGEGELGFLLLFHRESRLVTM